MKRTLSKETKERMRLAKLGKPRPEMVGNKFAVRKMSKEEIKMRSKTAKEHGIGKWMLGRTAWNKGKSNTWAIGKKNKLWKGDLVGNGALHDWVKRYLGFPNKCEMCSFSSQNHHKMHWSNISGKYKRDLVDWQRLCVPCHKKFDLNRKKLLPSLT